STCHHGCGCGNVGCCGAGSRGRAVPWGNVRPSQRGIWCRDWGRGERGHTRSYRGGSKRNHGPSPASVEERCKPTCREHRTSARGNRIRSPSQRQGHATRYGGTDCPGTKPAGGSKCTETKRTKQRPSDGDDLRRPSPSASCK